MGSLIALVIGIILGRYWEDFMDSDFARLLLVVEADEPQKNDGEFNDADVKQKGFKKKLGDVEVSIV